MSQQRHRNSSSVDRLKSPGISSANNNSLGPGMLARTTPPEKRMSPSLPQPPDTKKMKKEEVRYCFFANDCLLTTCTIIESSESFSSIVVHFKE